MTKFSATSVFSQEQKLCIDVGSFCCAERIDAEINKNEHSPRKCYRIEYLVECGEKLDQVLKEVTDISRKIG